MANHARPIVLAKADRAELERVQRASSEPAGFSRRARVVLLMADDVSGAEIARMTGYTVVQVSRLRRRFAEEGLAGLQDKPRSGRPPVITARKRAQVVAKTLKPPGAGLTLWSARELAAAVGVSHTTVHRIWKEHKLKPHQVRSFKFSKDPRLAEKVIDVVGLYLDPPAGALVLCVDEKTQIQALDRTQPSLPIKPGKAARMTHDYKRNGTTATKSSSRFSTSSCAPTRASRCTSCSTTHRRTALQRSSAGSHATSACISTSPRPARRG